jgi:gas vesicle protein
MNWNKRPIQVNNSHHATGANWLNPTRLISGLLIGGLAGFCAVILVVPRPGKITRDQIEQKSIQARKRAVDIYDELLLLSQFDERKILSGTRTKDQN